MIFTVKNTGAYPVTMLDVEGEAHVFTPGLSLYKGESDAIDEFAEIVEGIAVQPIESLKSLSVAAFTKTIEGQITVETVKALLATTSLKTGQVAALKSLATREGIAA